LLEKGGVESCKRRRMEWTSARVRRWPEQVGWSNNVVFKSLTLTFVLFRALRLFVLMKINNNIRNV
jgi:hypothetical protein